MEFVARQSDLLQELGLVQGVVERKTTIPILANILLDARKTKKGGEVEILATDLEVGIRTVCHAEVRKEGSMTLPARRLHDIVRLLPPGGEVDFSLKDGNWVNVTCERIRYRLAGAGTADFPTLSSYDFKDSLTLELAPLKAMIERIVFAISAEDPRYALNGALMMVGEGNVSLVATDGHRLAFITRPDPGATGSSQRILVPRKTLAELQKFDPGPEGEVRFGVQGSQMFFRCGPRLLQSNTVDGTFPNYERVLPQGNDRIAIVAADSLRQALDRVALLSQERTKGVRLALEPGKVVISTQNPEMGEAEETVTADYDGPAFQIGFNSRYLVEYLQASGSPAIRMELKDETGQGLFRPEDPNQAAPWDYRYVVMPMRLTSEAGQ